MIHSTRKRRVAAYARVSTDSEEQYTSYVAQVSYYTDYIKRNTEWDLWMCIPMKVSPAPVRKSAMVSTV